MRLRPGHIQTAGWAVGGLALVGLLGLAGCLSSSRRPTDLTGLTPPYRVEIHEGGRAVAEHTVTPGSPQELAIARWLQAHETGWRTDPNTYAPKRRIQGDRFDLNFTGRLCVMNYDPEGKGERVQVSRTIEDPDALPPSVFSPDR